MMRPVDLFARRVETDRWFLASALKVYAESEGLNDEQMAATLGCPIADLTALRLCRRPQSESVDTFRRDINALVHAYGVRAEVIAEVVRRADAIDSLRRTVEGITGSPNMLMAARDRERKDERVLDGEDEVSESETSRNKEDEE